MNITRRTATTIFALGLGLSVALTGCTGTAPANEDVRVTEVKEITLPDTSYGVMVGTLVEHINAVDAADASAWEGNFTAELAESFTAEQLAELVNVEFRPYQPVIVTAFTESKDSAVARIVGKNGKTIDLTIALGADGEQLAGIYFNPVAG